jgi:carboxyl-terminal processing protease
MNKNTREQRGRVTEVAPQKTSRWQRVLFGITGGMVVFLLGWGLGAGKIHISAFSGLNSQNSNLPNSLDMSSVQEVYRALRDNYDGELDTDKLLDGMKSGLAQSTGDPYTEYMNAEQAQDFRNDLNGTFSGIGAELGKEGDSIVIVSPIADYPAAKAGLQAKDIIVSIDDKPTTGMTLSEAVNAIRGPSGSQVKLKVIQDGAEKDITITRENITIPSVKWEVTDGIGYMTISTFSEDTPGLAKQAAQDFKNQNVKGVVVDVRGNPGGLLDSSVAIASLWLPKGTPVLSEQRGGKVIKSYDATGDAILQGVPTVVLIDDSSASASEILAGALQDNKAATLIGTTSYGKGSVQSLIQLPSGGVLKVTIARWYTPEGQNIDKEGITPDQKVDRSIDDIKANRDPQKDAASQKLQQ